MYSIKVIANFSAAHNLRGYKGKCEDLHGHNWKVEVAVRRKTLDGTGMVMDFSQLKACVYAALDKLDHKYLNHLPHFKKVNPTSENIAQYIYRGLAKEIADVASVTVWENDTSCATYEE